MSTAVGCTPAGSRSEPEESRSASTPLSVALVNNMPDGAFRQTELQFERLLQQPVHGTTSSIRRYAFPSVRHGKTIEAWIAKRYEPLAELPRSRPDIVIVTGSAPSAGSVEEEPSFSELAALLTWATAETSTLVASCLSAHVALSVLDGLRRTRLPAKRTGAFWHAVRPRAALAHDLPSRMLLPHSRYNEVDRRAIEEAGYSVIVDSLEAGWAIATRRRGPCELVMMQAHPEYDATSLLFEYRRDVRRFLEGAVSTLPELPARCARNDDMNQLRVFQQRLTRVTGSGEGGELPFAAMAKRAEWHWGPAARHLYRNLLSDAYQRSRPFAGSDA